MSDPRGFFTKVLYAFNDDYRAMVNREWQTRHGTPPPWTAAGQRYLADLERYNELLSNPPKLHGDAQWMSRTQAQELAIAGAPKDGIGSNVAFYLGNAVDMEKMEIHSTAVSMPPGHVLTVAATRAGKGAAQIIPNLVAYGGSMLVIDPKGENYALTHAHRRKLGRVVRIDPFRVTEKDDKQSAFSCFNPVMTIEDSDDARSLAENLLGDRPEGEAQFFYDEAMAFLTPILLFVAQSPEPTMRSVRHICCLPNDPPITGDGDSELKRALKDIIHSANSPVIINALRAFLGKHDRLQSSILSTVTAATAIWDEPKIDATVSDHHFDLEMLKKGKLTVYVILPFDKIRTYRSFLRMFVGLFYRAMQRDPTPPDVPVACLIDEFPALGQMNEIVGALAEIAGYGVRFWLFVQGLAQLKSIYPKNYELILSQCATKSVFGVTDGETAEWLSKEVGNTTVAVGAPTLGNSGGGVDAKGYPTGGANTGRSIHFAGKPLLSPAEIREEFGVGGDMKNRKRFQVVFLSGYPPLIATLEPWFTNELLTDLLTVPQSLPAALPAPTPSENTEAPPWWTGIPSDYQYGVKVKDDDNA